jgi:hypothetical protein
VNILLLLAHSIAEYDDLRMFHDLGYNVMSIGAYTNPSAPGDDKRPALPQVPFYPELSALVDKAGGTLEAKEHIPDGILDWADVIICHHYLDKWVADQWERIKHKRVIWRTCGQSDPRLEMRMAPLRRQGLQIVRYSPKEADTFAPMGAYAGKDALIRFGKYLSDYPSWDPYDYVANVTQDMAGRGEHCGFSWYIQTTAGLKARPAGPNSEVLPGGVGALSYEDMLVYLRHAAAYAYAGTVPASYTLGLIEAMAVGVPIVSIGPRAWQGPDSLFEGHELADDFADDPKLARAILGGFIDDARAGKRRGRLDQLELFDIKNVGPQWRQFLGEP